MLYVKKEVLHIAYKGEKEMAYNRKADKKYNSQSKIIGLKYTPNQIAEYERVKKYCFDVGISTQGYIKELIKADLDSKGIKYQEEPEREKEEKLVDI